MKKKFFKFFLFSLFFLPFSGVQAENFIDGHKSSVFYVSEQKKLENSLYILSENSKILASRNISPSLTKIGAENAEILKKNFQNLQEKTEFQRSKTLLENANAYIQLDLPKYLENKENSQKELENFIFVGDETLKKLSSKVLFLKTQEKNQKNLLSKAKTEKKSAAKQFSSAILENNPEKIEMHQKKYIDISTRLATQETDYEITKTLLLQHARNEQQLEKKLTGARKNFDALVLGVQIDKGSADAVGIFRVEGE